LRRPALALPISPSECQSQQQQQQQQQQQLSTVATAAAVMPFLSSRTTMVAFPILLASTAVVTGMLGYERFVKGTDLTKDFRESANAFSLIKDSSSSRSGGSSSSSGGGGSGGGGK